MRPILITFRRMTWNGARAEVTTRLASINPEEVSHLVECEQGTEIWMRNGRCVWVSATLLEAEAKLDPDAERVRRAREKRYGRTDAEV